VKGKLNPSPGLHIIQLQEIESEFPLLEPPFVASDSQPVSTNCNLKLKKRIFRCLPNCMYIGELNVTDRDVPFIIKEAIGTRNCSFLDLNHNSITAEGARLIANVLSQNTSLKVLRFWHNHLLDSGASYIAQALCSNTSLTTLCFTSNGLTDACVSDIALMLKENQTLMIFYLNHNAIADDGMIILMNSLCYNKTLKQLYLHENAITNISNDSIEKMFNKNHTLQKLSLGDNQLSKQGKTYLRNLASQKTHRMN
jgi:Ran GTPase-activating protein (RanGAP) involved in mRNA processing and transport